MVLTSIGATCVLWILGSLVTRPDDEEALVEFYKRARPMGFWGPIARKAGDKALADTIRARLLGYRRNRAFRE